MHLFPSGQSSWDSHLPASNFRSLEAEQDNCEQMQNNKAIILNNFMLSPLN